MKTNKKVLGIIMGLMLLALGSAVLVDYLSNTVTTDVTVESPFFLGGAEFDLDIIYSGDNSFALIEITNKANSNITADFELTVNDKVGISIAISDDINYCWETLGNMDDVTQCALDYETWLGNNIDWMDWVATEDYSNTAFSNSNVVNTNGDSFTNIGYTGNSVILEDITFTADSTVYALVYVGTDPALAPATYTFEAIIVPTTI